MFGVCLRLFCVCVVLCLGRGLVTGWSLAQRVLPSVKNDYGTEKEARALNGLEEPSVSVLRWREKTATQLGPLERTNLIPKRRVF
jgi:hypothetical protein